MAAMTSVKWQFAAVKLCPLLKKPGSGGMLIAMLTKSTEYVYEIISIVLFMFFARKPT